MVRQRPATKVTFTLRPLPVQWGTPGRGCPPGLNFGADEVVEVPMPWSGLDGAEDLFTCVLDTPGTMWGWCGIPSRWSGWTEKNGEQLASLSADGVRRWRRGALFGLERG